MAGWRTHRVTGARSTRNLRGQMKRETEDTRHENTYFVWPRAVAIAAGTNQSGRRSEMVGEGKRDANDRSKRTSFSPHVMVSYSDPTEIALACLGKGLGTNCDVRIQIVSASRSLLVVEGPLGLGIGVFDGMHASTICNLTFKS